MFDCTRKLRTWAEDEARAILANTPALEGMSLDACVSSVLLAALARTGDEAEHLRRKVARLEARIEGARAEVEDYIDGAPDAGELARVAGRVEGFLSGDCDPLLTKS